MKGGAFWEDCCSVKELGGMYGTKVEQGFAITLGSGLPKNVKGCKDGCRGYGPGGICIGMGNGKGAGAMTTE